MDLTIEVEDYKLNIRAAAIIIHNNKLLTHKDTRLNFYGLLGGRIAIGEDSKTTILREMQEEMGKEVEIIGDIGTIENFFKTDGYKYHEIEIIHRAEFVNEEDKKIEQTIKNIEGKDHLEYEWVDIEKIDEYDIRPQIIKKILKEKRFPVHEIYKD